MRNFAIAVAILLGLSGSGSAAEEVRSNRFLMQPGSLICDTMVQLVQTLEAGETVEGCALLQRPMLVEAVKLAPFVTEKLTFFLVRYEFPYKEAPEAEIKMWIQYGFWGRPQPIPAKYEVEA